MNADNDPVVEAHRLVLAWADARRRLICAIDAYQDPDPHLEQWVLARRVHDYAQLVTQAAAQVTHAVATIVGVDLPTAVQAVVDECTAIVWNDEASALFAATDPVLDDVAAAPWSTLWPDTWQQTGTETIGNHTVEHWQRPGDTTTTALCWTEACTVLVNDLDGLPGNGARHTKAVVLAWRTGITLHQLADMIRTAAEEDAA